MKKLLFLAMAVLATFCSCSRFDSKPIEPNIIGVGYLQYDSVSQTCYTTVDSMSYTVTSVTIPNEDLHSWSVTQDIAPMEGAKVTIFTSKKSHGIQAVLGEQDEEQIEALYHKNYTAGIIVLSIFGVAIILLVIMDIPKKSNTSYSKK